MSKEISWKEKFELVLKEELTIKELLPHSFSFQPLGTGSIG